MEDKDIDETEFNPWVPIEQENTRKILCKLTEEAGELISAASRCLMQGINEKHPVTGKINRIWLEDEIADLECLIKFTKSHFILDVSRINERHKKKKQFLFKWFYPDR